MAFRSEISQRIVLEWRFTQGMVFSRVLVRKWTQLWWYGYLECCRKLDRTPNHPISNSNEAYLEMYASTSHYAIKAITMHSECKDNVEHNPSTLWHEKGQNVTECDVKTWAVEGTKRHTNLSFSANTIIHARILISITCDASRQHDYTTYHTSIVPY